MTFDPTYFDSSYFNTSGQPEVSVIGHALRRRQRAIEEAAPEAAITDPGDDEFVVLFT